MTRRTGAGIVVVLLLALGAALALYAVRSETPVATSSATPTAVALSTTPPATSTRATTAVPTATGTPSRCDTYQTGDTPIVAPRLSGQWLRVALDAVRPGQSGHNRWALRFMLASDAPANAEIALNVTVTGPNGPLEVFRYSAAPPNAGDGPVTQPLTLLPCGSTTGSAVIVLITETGGVTSGTYTITSRDIRRPEGDRVNEAFTVALTCTVDPGPAAGTSCR